ncbi:MAG TPA: hypothetical protein VNO50_08950 [Pyrinomonadaceae bacterium]|nr:hypothetical protein [Pyrinomonadaceae bacterium]
MKRWKKLLLILLTLLVVSQIPFAYRRHKLGRLHTAIQQVNSQRLPKPESNFTEYTGVMHVHSFLGGHSTGNFEDIIAAAQSNQLDFVVMTEHTSDKFNTAAMTLKGWHGGILFINGNEVLTASSERLLLLPGDEQGTPVGSPSAVEDVLGGARANGRLALIAYPQEFKSWSRKGLDGVEVYNVYTNALQINPVVMFFDGLWSYRSYPELLFANFYRRPDENLKKWDEAQRIGSAKLVATAGNDAHSNVGFSLNSYAGKPLLGLKLDPYERSFRLVRLHVLVPMDQGLSNEVLLAAIAGGHCFIGFDLFGDTSGFGFAASSGNERKIQGDEIFLDGELKLVVSVPASGRIVILKDGTIISDRNAVSATELVVSEKGNYRVEVYLPQLGKPVGDQPWIISNPIYVR